MRIDSVEVAEDHVHIVTVASGLEPVDACCRLLPSGCIVPVAVAKGRVVVLPGDLQSLRTCYCCSSVVVAQFGELVGTEPSARGCMGLEVPSGRGLHVLDSVLLALVAYSELLLLVVAEYQGPVTD